MNLTNSHNIDLARAIGMDASAISRLRTGKRRPARTLGFIPNMSAFFAERMADEHQKKTAADAICPGEAWPEGSDAASCLISKWLTEGRQSHFDSVEQLLHSVSALSFPSAPSIAPSSLSASEHPAPQELFYGIDGVRLAVLKLLDLAIVSGKRLCIYMYSDENSHWLAEDHKFLQGWVSRLKLLIANGCTVKIIHNTARALPDVLFSMSKWLPLYITGAVEPYYYPKIRDDVYHRTVFVADGLAAMQVSSVEGFDEHTLVHLLTEPQGVQSLKNEFFSFLKLCRPMLEVIYNNEVYHEKLLEHDLQPGDYFMGSTTPSLCTMPAIVAERISYRSGSNRLYELYLELSEMEQTKSDGRRMCEIINIPTPQQIYDDTIPVAISLPLGIPGCYYTASEYAMHLRALADFARVHRSYRFALTDRLPQNTSVYCKDNRWAVVTKFNRPSISFSIEQPTAAEALSVYLRQLYTSAQASAGSCISLPELLRRLYS